MQLSVGVDVGGTKVLAVLVGADGAVVSEARASTPLDNEELLDVVAKAAAEVGAGSSAHEVGVGVPGLVDRDGLLRFAPNLPGVLGVPVRAGLEGRLPGVSVRVGNDATFAGWAEHVLGAGRGHDDMLMVTLGTGIGGGLVCGGRLVEGANGFAGEIGHMVIDPQGPRCLCGRRGCWERLASGSGLGRLGREAGEAGQAARVVALAGGDPEAIRGEHVTVAAAEGDEEARAVMASFAWWVALGLANLANIFDPACIVLGGGMIGVGPELIGPVLIDPVRSAFVGLVEAAQFRPPIEVVPAELGAKAGAIGAALLARR
jgi:glucokinase